MPKHWSDYRNVDPIKGGYIIRGSVVEYVSLPNVLFQGCVPIYDDLNISRFWQDVVSTCKKEKAESVVFSDAYWGERSEMYRYRNRLTFSGRNPKGASVYRAMEDAPEDIARHLFKSQFKVNPNSNHVIRVYVFNAASFFEEKANETGL